MKHLGTATLILLLSLAACAGGPDIDRRGEPSEGSPARGGDAATAPVGVPGEPAAPTGSRETSADVERSRASIGGVAVVLEVADDDAERSRGLAGRAELAPDTGMIFVYPRSEPRSFWMEGCLIGLDIAYLDDEQRIFALKSLDPPAPGDAAVPRFPSGRDARFVIEMRKGWFAEHGVGEGDRVTFSPELAARARAIEESAP